ncbi:PAS domain-containing protein [Corallococcus sp. CA047B]|uniref:sensor histidine kinase n=1 Tax=Corallococcus sp. CA047B TaxID=2316729 RepID=UPI000EA31E7D|nr:ATP-binding protein [Corallococcus sp. CA047B]RKH16112.1 PAS domain-containing protein [Corallococcus sp. CA047B]
MRDLNPSGLRADGQLLQDAPFLTGDGEMARRMREFDWASCPVGPVEQWPQSLRTAVSICLSSRHPIEIWWGPQFARLYNDAYRPILGVHKHPQFLGRPGWECWGEIWDVIGPMLESVRATGKATWSEDFPLMMWRNGYLEETYFTFSYAPLWNEDGSVGGIFCACAETTPRLLSERRLRLLRDLGAQTAATATVKEACEHAMKTLGAGIADVSFALLYQLAPEDAEPTLSASMGFVGSEQLAVAEGSTWPFAEVVQTQRLVRVALPEAHAPWPGGAWPEPSREALVLPLFRSGESTLQGFLVMGVNPRRSLDDAYRDFFELAAGHVATTLSSARVFEERTRLLAREQAALAEAERQRSRLETLFLQAPAGICVLRGTDHVFEFANARYIELLGGRDVVGKPLREALPELKEVIVPLLDRVYSTGEPFFGNELQVPLRRTEQVQDYFFNFIYQPIYDPSGTIEGISVIAFEVTEQVHARQRSERLTQELEATNQDLDQFAYVASHDLKAPLRGIASLSEWIEEGMADKMSEETRHQMGLLRGRVHRLEALINGILSYSRVSRTREKLETVDVGALLAESRDLLAPRPEASIVIGGGMPTLQVERVPLQQVFLNLMSNALKHAGRTDARIDIACADADDFYDFTLKDNGPGIDPRFHDRIWGIFQTLEARDKVEGTGIGLSVVKKIVETRGGRVAIESEVGAGATFHIYWPKRPRGHV